MEDYQNFEISEAVADGEESRAGPSVESVIRQPSFSEVLPLCKFREVCWAGTAAPCPGSWTWRSRDARRGLTQLPLSLHPLNVYVMTSDPEAPEEVHGLIGFTRRSWAFANVRMPIWPSFSLG